MYEITKAKIFCRAVKSQQNCNRNESPISSKQNIIESFTEKLKREKISTKKSSSAPEEQFFPVLCEKVHRNRVLRDMVTYVKLNVSSASTLAEERNISRNAVVFLTKVC